MVLNQTVRIECFGNHHTLYDGEAELADHLEADLI